MRQEVGFRNEAFVTRRAWSGCFSSRGVCCRSTPSYTVVMIVGTSKFIFQEQGHGSELWGIYLGLSLHEKSIFTGTSFSTPGKIGFSSFGDAEALRTHF